MAGNYRIIGSEESPYSVKVRSYFRYKGIDHEWLSRFDAQDLFAQHAKLPLVPLVVTPDEQGMQDSTPILEKMEAAIAEPSLYPGDAVSRFISALLEEFGDEWGNKWMFYMRWAREIDQVTVSRRFAGHLPEDQIDEAAKTIRERMVPRVWFVGGSELTGPQIEQSFADTLSLIEAHLARRPYFFGGRPAFADFGFWGQIYNAGRDPTAGEIVSGHANVMAWVERMLNPQDTGDFEDWDTLAETLTPLLRDQVAGMFLPWSVANAEAIAGGDEEFSVTLKGNTWTQKPQKYHARSLDAIRQKYAQVKSDALDGVLEETGCLQYLA